MSANIFDKSRACLENAKFSIIKAEYNPNPRDNWAIIVDTKPQKRILWDGVASMLVIQKESKGAEDWTDIWSEEGSWEEIMPLALTELKKEPARVM